MAWGAPCSPQQPEALPALEAPRWSEPASPWAASLQINGVCRWEVAEEPLRGSSPPSEEAAG